MSLFGENILEQIIYEQNWKFSLLKFFVKKLFRLKNHSPLFAPEFKKMHFDFCDFYWPAKNSLVMILFYLTSDRSDQNDFFLFQADTVSQCFSSQICYIFIMLVPNKRLPFLAGRLVDLPSKCQSLIASPIFSHFV